MDVGPGKVRRRTTAGVTKFTIGLKLTRNQVALFDEFFRTSAKGGALAFQWTHPRTGNPIDYRFADVPQLKPYAPRQAAGTEYWTATFTLEALPGTEITEPEPPINPSAIPVDYSAFVIEGLELPEPAFDIELIDEVHREADAIPPEALLVTFIDNADPSAEDPFFTGVFAPASGGGSPGGGTIPGGPGGTFGGGGGPGGGIN